MQVFPHHTDYAGVVWHGSYINWLEEARVVWLERAGVSYGDLVASGIELPVMEIALKYHRSAVMGDRLKISAKCDRSQGIRLIWDYAIHNQQHNLCVSAAVTLAPVDMQRGKIIRQFPTHLQRALENLQNCTQYPV